MSFSEFYQRSINEPEAFWAEQARRIDWRQPFTQTLDHSRPPFARWFCGGTTNLCHNAVDRWRDKQPEALALIAVSSETDEERTFTFSQLHDEVNAVAAMLLSLGVQRGDRVLVYMPMIAEAQITLLACARIGAIHSVVFGGFASHSVAARIDDARPALIVSADAGARGGKILPYKKLLDDAIAQAQHQPKHVLLVDRGLAKMAWVDGRDLDFATLRQQHLLSLIHICHFWRQGGRRILLRIGYRLGRRPLLYRLRAAAGRHGDYCLRRTADVPGLRGLVENCREIPG